MGISGRLATKATKQTAAHVAGFVVAQLSFYKLFCTSSSSAYSPMSAPHYHKHMPMGTSSAAHHMGGKSTEAWLYNDMLRIVTHEALSCTVCSSWAQHYMEVVFCKNRSLREAEEQRMAVLLAQHTAKQQAELEHLREAVRAAHKKHAASNNEVIHLRDEIDNLNRGTTRTIGELKDTIRDLKDKI
jgi:hypothetical protein